MASRLCEICVEGPGVEKMSSICAGDADHGSMLPAVGGWGSGTAAVSGSIKPACGLLGVGTVGEPSTVVLCGVTGEDAAASDLDAPSPSEKVHEAALR
jgi:hypothetical protein